MASSPEDRADYRVVADAWIAGRHHVAGTTLRLAPAQAAALLVMGQIEPAPKTRAKA
ncbi:hypothetical protein P7L75_01475 (plasmid) [Tistrella mobilis]|uniref:hypothetical protein n=1 Tax=Tistrella mobilis TaxID=171437 RepID=UPI00355878E0